MATEGRATRTRRHSAKALSSDAAKKSAGATQVRKRASTRRRSTKATRQEEEEEEDALEGPSTPPKVTSPVRPFAPTPAPPNTSGRFKVKTAAAKAVEDAAVLLNTVQDSIQKSPIVSRISESTQKIQVKLSPTILAAFILAIVVSGILSLAVVPMIHEQSDSEVGDGILQIQRKLYRLENSLEEVKGKISSYASTAEIQKLKDQQKILMEKQADLGALLKKELAKLKVEHISDERIKTEVARALANRADPADYASYSASGRVIGHSNLYPRKGDPWLVPNREGDWYLFSVPYLPGLPEVVSSALKKVFPVHPKASIWLLSVPPTGIEVPGHCLPLNGSSGHVDIRLRSEIELKSISIEHISAVSSFNINTAPKEMRLLKLESEGGLEELATFTYNIQSTPVQVFPMKATSGKVSKVRLQIESNWGSEDYTCLYRFKAYGQQLS